MNEVLYGYTLNETNKQLKYYKEFNFFRDFDINSLILNQNIKMVLLSDIGHKKQYFRKILLKNGFQDWKTFENENTTNKILALVRKEK